MILSLPKLLLVFALSASAAVAAQTGTATPKLSPQAAYESVMRPLEITRRSTGNWSDAETSALAVSIQQATAACAARQPSEFAGDDLIAYARLCALGQQWPAVEAAADRYIAGDGPKPQLSQAYAFKVNSLLHTGDAKAILAGGQKMLHAVAYDSLVDETLNAALRYLQLVYTAEALTLYADRELILLQAIQAHPPPGPQGVAAVQTAALYDDGLAFAALQQFAGDAQAAAKTVADLDAALPPQLAPDDGIAIAQGRRQYALLGTHLPRIPLTLSLYAVGETPRINTNYGSSTVLFLFPEWCAQCVRMAQQFRATLYRISQNDVHLYGLMAQEAPSVAGAPPAGKAKAAAEIASPPKPADLLRGSPTLIVPPATLVQFAADDFPLLIATDSKGIIRFVQPASENALNPGDLLDQVTAHIAQQWPREAPAKVVSVPGSAHP